MERISLVYSISLGRTTLTISLVTEHSERKKNFFKHKHREKLKDPLLLALISFNGFLGLRDLLVFFFSSRFLAVSFFVSLFHLHLIHRQQQQQQKCSHKRSSLVHVYIGHLSPYLQPPQSHRQLSWTGYTRLADFRWMGCTSLNTRVEWIMINLNISAIRIMRNFSHMKDAKKSRETERRWYTCTARLTGNLSRRELVGSEDCVLSTRGDY